MSLTANFNFRYGVRVRTDLAMFLNISQAAFAPMFFPVFAGAVSDSHTMISAELDSAAMDTDDTFTIVDGKGVATSDAKDGEVSGTKVEKGDEAVDEAVDEEVEEEVEDDSAENMLRRPKIANFPIGFGLKSQTMLRNQPKKFASAACLVV